MLKMNAKVVVFENALKVRAQKVEESLHKEYLALLSFSDLINESQQITDELKVRPLDTELSTRSTLLLKEISERIGGQFKMLEELKSSIDERLRELQ